MNYLKEREAIVEYGKKLITEGLTSGTGGNISLFLREEGVMLISPSGIPYFDTKMEDIVVMDLEGTIVEGDRKPSVNTTCMLFFTAIVQMLIVWFTRILNMPPLLLVCSRKLNRCITSSARLEKRFVVVSIAPLAAMN